MIALINTEPCICISHSHADVRKVSKIEKRIRESGISYFLDQKNLEYGEEAVERARNGIETCTHLLVYISSASLSSQWVFFEIGMAWALRRQVICYLDHPRLHLPSVIENVKVVTKSSELTSYLRKLIKHPRHESSTKVSSVERQARDALYYYPGGCGNAIRLFGADDECITEDRIKVRYTHRPLIVPSDLNEITRKVIKEEKEKADKEGKILFNGPNTRLVRWRATPKDSCNTALEEKILELELGPVSYYDYRGLHGGFRKLLQDSSIGRLYEDYLGYSKLVRDGDVSGSRLSNLLDTASTVVSSDGFVGYQERSYRVSSVPGKFTSAVAENINRYLDESDPTDSKRLFNSFEVSGKKDRNLDYTYEPKGVPHPFAAVRRGLAEELSPELLSYTQPGAIILTGLSFDLEALHPDALFAIFVQLSKSDILEVCRSDPGKDWFEGKLYFLPADFENKETLERLNEKRWVPAGKVSLVRTIQLINTIKRRHACSFEEAFDILVKPQ